MEKIVDLFFACEEPFVLVDGEAVFIEERGKGIFGFDVTQELWRDVLRHERIERDLAVAEAQASADGVALRIIEGEGDLKAGWQMFALDGGIDLKLDVRADVRHDEGHETRQLVAVHDEVVAHLLGGADQRQHLLLIAVAWAQDFLLVVEIAGLGIGQDLKFVHGDAELIGVVGALHDLHGGRRRFFGEADARCATI